MFSGGIGSFFAAKRVIDKVDREKERVVLLFADTLIEDEDLYRFIKDAENYFGIKITKLTEGRTPWEVFFDVNFLGNSRIDPCSKLLKRNLLNDWVRNNYSEKECIVYMGIDWTESHRIENVQKRVAPYIYLAPLCEKPLLDKGQMFIELEKIGIKRPRLYDLGFYHNNCGGFCIKSGQAQFKLLLEKFPDRYKFHEEMEQKIREKMKKDVTIMRIMRKGVKYNITLKDFREWVEKGGKFDPHEWGGCGCAL